MGQVDKPEGGEARVMGIWTTMAMVVGCMIGTGIFMLPAAMANLGGSAVGGWGVVIGGTVLLAIVFARMLRVVKAAGGPYAYPAAAFGPLVGCLVAWAYWIGCWAGMAANLVAGVGYSANQVPWLAGEPLRQFLCCMAVLWGLVLINLRGPRSMGGFQIITTLLKLTPIVAAVWLGLSHTGTVTAAAVEAPPVSLNGVVVAAALAMYAMLGFEVASISTDKVIDPERTVPRALVGGVVITGLIYVFACMSVIWLLPNAGSSTAPFADLLTAYWGRMAGATVTVFMLISIIGCINGTIWVAADLLRVMAEEGVVPRILAHQNKCGAPDASLILCALLISGFTLTNFAGELISVYTFMILVSTSANLIGYLAVSLAAAKMAADRKFGVLGRQASTTGVFAVGGTLYSLWIIYGAGIEANLWVLVLTATGLPVYYYSRSAAQRLQKDVPVAE